MKLTLKPRVLNALCEIAHEQERSCAAFINAVLEAIANGDLDYPQKEGKNEKREKITDC